MHIFRRSLPGIAAFLSVALAVITHAQQTVPATPTIVVESKLVVLDVVATDAHGKIRDDLHQADFTVYEDGVAQKILHFESPSAHAVPTGVAIHSTADLERLAPDAPATVVVLDEMNTRYEDMAYARYAVKKYLDAQPGSLAAPTMLLAVNSDHLQVIQDYTQDRGQLVTALDHHLAHYPWNMQQGQSVIQRLALTLGALEQVAKAAAGHRGHKNVLWVGRGFPGINLSSPSIDENSSKGITSGVQQALNMLRDSRVTLYTIDPTVMTSEVGVRYNGNDSTQQGDLNSADPFLSDISFAQFASSTGGKTFVHRNDVDREISESALDGENYYTLTYRPSNNSDAEKTYRKINVKISDSSVRVGFRDGYYVRNDDAPTNIVARSAYDIDAAAENRLVYTGLSLKSVERPDDPSTFLVGVPQEQLGWSDEGEQQVAHLKMVSAVFDPKGKLLSRMVQELTERRSSSNGSNSGMARIEVHPKLVPKASRIRFVVWDQKSGHIGTTEIHLSGAAPDEPVKR